MHATLEQHHPISHVGSVTPDPLYGFARSLWPFFNENAPAALLTWLAFRSGGSGKPIALGLAGQSCAGKTYLSGKVAELVCDRTVVQTSRITLAGLFALKRFDVLVEDELIDDPGYLAVRRQLISTGSATRILSTPDGKLRQERMENSVAFITCLHTNVDRNFQDNNRQIVCPLSETPAQIQFHARRVASSYTAAGECEARQWVSLCTAINSQTQRPIPVLFEDTADLVPHSVDPQNPRRIDQALRVATQIAVLRHGPRTDGGDCDNDGANIIGTAQDIRDALALLHLARVMDDGPTLREADRVFLSIVAKFLPDTKSGAMSIGAVVKALNTEPYASMAAQVVDRTKQRGPAARATPEWTRGIVTRRAKALFEVGLLNMTPGSRPQIWLTSEGRGHADRADANSFAQMFAAFGKSNHER